ncbi:hypothetical protein PISL3812_00478 [Talaromyces islandicus]|uniref:Mediator of RNA polymerase II transcription subunit 20 n=1 Tax=Talaromyces islandicus TaxID=28573 RepID=A0A0U1LLC5_TALIS|nr:hypothetical protein PISL3812_00478 [Talaromyces islandicus]
MPHTGVFFIPSSPSAPNIVTTLTERLRAVYGDEVVPIGRWGVEHKLMRDTPSCLPASAHAPNPVPRARYMQFLSTNNYPKVGFIYASENTATTTTATTTQQAAGQQQRQSGMLMSTVPVASSLELFRHFVRACEPLWCHRHTVTATGNMYDVGDFRVRLGEVRQTQPQVRARGTIMEVEWKGVSLIAAATAPSTATANSEEEEGEKLDFDSIENVAYVPTEEEVDTEYTQIAQVIREFWGRLDIADSKTAREAILVPDVGKEVRQKLHQRRQPGWAERDALRRRKRLEAIALDRSWGGAVAPLEYEDNADAGVDLARQYMELFRFNR